MPHATSPNPGLQVFILCGPGESLSTFTSNPKDFSKALIPIANRPMVWYPIDWCCRMGITDIVLITPPESQPALQSALVTHPALTSLPIRKLEILAPRDLTQTTGTGALLRLPEVQSAITSDFVILPCDLISELDGIKLIQRWMELSPINNSHRSTTNQLTHKGGLGVYYPTAGLDDISHKKDETDFIATTKLQTSGTVSLSGRLHLEKLVIAMPTDTMRDKLEEHEEFFKVRTALQQKVGQVDIKTKHRDAHVYIFPIWVKKFVAKNETFDSISEDVMGWWAKAQWQDGLGDKLSMEEALNPKKTTKDDLADSSHLEEDDTAGLTPLSTTKVSLPLRCAVQKTAAFASRVANAASTAIQPAPLVIPPLMAYVQPSRYQPTPARDSPLIRRVDNSHALLSVSLYLAKQPTTHTLSHENKVHPTVRLGQQSRVAQEDCLIAENTIVGFRSIIKESVIGMNCEIGNNVRLTKCLLMDGVTICDGAQLTGCIIGRRARVESLPTATELPSAEKGKTRPEDDDDRTRLTECEVAPYFKVESGTEAKGEKFSSFDTAELYDDDEEYQEEDED
ncbi:Translation initiation factor eIF-2B subunit gamma [Fulvia fulva]|uniref:Translation initiation factor eIF2B subunit gamma n=1 Tax=Passalora fulva TaxID=5499 RepID=A0A9Q8PHP9_PASFU|nr:Translation initiation factor eIF-2B subunit gamma [Fulvia fulva]KAK4616221.1 Translation initiation factor eIF-2B subunit gamma [Fulvia fulva]KAK4616395.1 Translation initiation factor eIF-2B subunit gamma [Fulvia fulva]UJO22612.1 Translation initiation factor eIF-2B subunit gamma [Fulvia fulva]WPV19070.1 Translation initiation factor eIF-2B subunit gamma [Fulvia fulva]WPV34416.1 Translation initiation factor eIF-2B subunit gamma [Fulvia fulva]